MPFEKFPVLNNPDLTLKLWSRKLEYLFGNLDTDNVTSTSLLGTDSVKDFMIDFGNGLQQVNALDVPISSTKFTSTSVEGALDELAPVSNLVGNVLSTSLASVASSDLNATNSITNQIRTSLLTNGLLTT